MTLPRQGRREPRGQAPYNFVPLPDSVYAPQDPFPSFSRYEPGRHTGHVEVRLTTETWCYVRAAVTPEYAAKNPELSEDVWNERSAYRAFFHHGDPARPSIPGSSMRGMLRQLIEVMSDGALTTAPDRPIFYRAVAETSRLGRHYRRRFVGPNTDARKVRDGRIDPDPDGFPQRLEYPVRVAESENRFKRYAVHGGYIFRRGREWCIRPAMRLPAGSHESFVRVEDSDLPPSVRAHEVPGVTQVWVVPATPIFHRHRVEAGQARLALGYAKHRGPVRLASEDAPTPEAVKAHLVRTAILESDTRKHLHCAIFPPDPDADVLAVSSELRIAYESDCALPRAKGRTGRLLDPPVGEGGDRLEPCFYMTDASGAVVGFGGTLFFRLPARHRAHAFVPREERLDLPSRLFGTVARGRSIKGRLRFEDLDAVGITGEKLSPCGDVSPRSLLGPKPECVQHYLVQPDSLDGLAHYEDEPLETTVLRGFKHYWHRRDETDPNRHAREAVDSATTVLEASRRSRDATSDPRRTRTVIRPIGEGIAFRGRIHFTNLSDEELGALILALDLRPRLRHKLGMARKAGLGTVRVERSAVRFVRPATRYGAFFVSVDSPEDAAPEATRALCSGWESDADRVVSAVRAFVSAMADHRGAPVPGSEADMERAVQTFWSAPRMRELEALLSWEGSPPHERTREVGVREDEKRAQWRKRHVLPPPHAVIGWPDPWPSGEVRPRGPSHVVGGVITRFQRNTAVWIKLDDRDQPQMVRLHADRFPLARWGSLTGGTLRPGRRVQVTTRGEEVDLVVPDDER